MYKDMIKRNFSRSAGTYDDHALIQKECALNVVGSIKAKDFSKILEIGCGTGMLTRLLRDTYKKAEIIAVDISESMIETASKKVPDKKTKFLVADGEHILMDNNVDLITSNATFQWFEDLDSTFERFNKMLKKGGMLCFSMYGPNTFTELEEVLSKNVGKTHILSSRKFITPERLLKTLEKHFEKFEVSEKYYTMDFISLWDLLKDIKRTGSRGEGLGNDVFLGKHMILALERDYLAKYGTILATHHVYFCKAQAKKG